LAVAKAQVRLLYRASIRLFDVRFSGESRDIPKCLSALADLRHHPDSGKRTLEEGHAA
jgi:hypothetical protein